MKRDKMLASVDFVVEDTPTEIASTGPSTRKQAIESSSSDEGHKYRNMKLMDKWKRLSGDDEKTGKGKKICKKKRQILTSDSEEEGIDQGKKPLKKKKNIKQSERKTEVEIKIRIRRQ